MIDDVRRENLETLADEHGTKKALADRLGISDTQLSQWINASAHSKTGKPRGMRTSTARKIERLVNKPQGWLDIDHRADSHTEIGSLAVKMFPLGCPKCGQVDLKSFIELEMNDEIPCSTCGKPVRVASYYAISTLETILKSFGGDGFSLRKR